MSNKTEELQSLQSALYEVQTLNQATELLNSALEVGDVAAETLQLVCTLIKASTIAILLEDGDDLKTFHAQGVHAEHIANRTWKKNRCVCGEVALTNVPILISGSKGNSDIPRELTSQFNERRNSIICVPIMANGQLYGSLFAVTTSQQQFSPNDLHLTTRFAKLLGDAFNRSFRYTEKANAEARYHTLLEESIIPIVVANRFGIIQMVNQSGTELLGYHNHQLMGEPIDLIHKSDIFENIRAKSELGGTIQLQTEVVSGEQQTIPVDLHVRLTHSGEFQWMYRDISEELMVEQMRNDLTAMLVHDLKGPLTNILTSLELLNEDLGDDDESMAGIMIQVASRSGQWLHHLVHSLLDVSQLEAGSSITDKRVVSVKEVVDSAKEIIVARLEAQSVDLVMTIPDEFPLICANQEMLKRVFLNLIDNALKFTPYGSKITVSAVQHAPNQVQFSVSDEGPGVPVEHRCSIFDKFYRTPDNKTKGIGLGLAFCSLAVEGHGGRIWVDSASGGGAQFNFTMSTANASIQP